jgi:uncharacterized protein (TIGR02246 family)
MDALMSSITDEIQFANTHFETLFQRGDSAGLAGLYTADGMLLPTGSGPLQGQEAITAYWQQLMNAGGKRVVLHAVEVEQVSQNTAVELGTYRLHDATDAEIDHGKYMGVWKHEGGQWKLQRDIWNSSEG